MNWQSKPTEAWNKFIKPETTKNGWLEDSSPISNEIDLSKRELFTLILFALARSSEDSEWFVGYDKNDSEPNDGYISNGNDKLHFEHKIVAQQEKPDVLELIIARYKKFSGLGKAYGENRVFVIHPNKESVPIKISDLTKKISEEECPFDSVFTLNCVADYGHTKVMHITQHYPYSGLIDNQPAKSQINFNPNTGEGSIELHNIKFD